jgi:peptidylprolyl isomerase
VALTPAAASAPAVEEPPEVVARLGTTEFTAAGLADFVRSLDPNVRKQALSDQQLMNRLVRLELARIAVLNEAKSKKWQQRPEVARQIERARDEVIANSYLTSVAMPPKDFPSDAQIQSAYELNRDKFMTARQYRLEQIYVALPAGADKKTTETARKKAEDLARKARAANTNFAALARTNSEHKPSAERGGDLGWAEETQIVPEIRKEIAGMAKDEISDPISAAGGWHIVRLVDTKPAAPRPLAEVKDSLVVLLRQRKTQDDQQAYVERLLVKAPVAVNETRLRKLFETAP